MSFTPNKELRQLVDQCLDSTISRVDMAKLETYLKDEESLDYYLSIASNEVLIPVALKEKAPELTASKSPKKHMIALAIAAALIFFVGVLVPSPFSNIDKSKETQLTPSSNSATITSIVGAVWDGNNVPSLKLAPGSDPIQLKSGLMELTFASGVRALIEGPAQIRIDGSNEATLSNGRLVADVPKGAEGFTVHYNAGKVVDLGTEFALYVPEDSQLAEVGVFKGEVEIYNKDTTNPIKITQNQAMIHGGEGMDAYRSVPFDHQAYIRDIPSREFKWSLDSDSPAQTEVLEFDVSHLVWRSGHYRAIMKWMHGDHATIIEQMELLYNDKVISSDSHVGMTGLISHTEKNTYDLHVDEESLAKGKWRLRATVRVSTGNANTTSTSSSGVLLFEDSLSFSASEKDFIGTWTYTFDGQQHQRVFAADHTALHFLDGRKNKASEGSIWSLDDGILTIKFQPKARNPEEHHILRSHGELIFVNRPYHNAIKQKD